ncbi:hypothetical protein CFP56_021464 [Quercus suber]|uniref:Remorin C-terminal domain-containing protein n=1 Tax=Quercus suber TaxID=58331 RepID=A0AAW0KEF1_QUESU
MSDIPGRCSIKERIKAQLPTIQEESAHGCYSQSHEIEDWLSETLLRGSGALIDLTASLAQRIAATTPQHSFKIPKKTMLGKTRTQKKSYHPLGVRSSTTINSMAISDSVYNHHNQSHLVRYSSDRPLTQCDSSEGCPLCVWSVGTEIDKWMDNSRTHLQRPNLVKAGDHELSNQTLPPVEEESEVPEELSNVACGNSIHGASEADNLNNIEQKSLLTRLKPYHAFLDDVKRHKIDAEIEAWKKAKYLKLMSKLERKEEDINDWEFEKTKKAKEEMKQFEAWSTSAIDGGGVATWRGGDRCGGAVEVEIGKVGLGGFQWGFFLWLSGFVEIGVSGFVEFVEIGTSGFVEIGWVVTGLVWIRIGWFGGSVVINDGGAVEMGVAVGGECVGLLIQNPNGAVVYWFCTLQIQNANSAVVIGSV